MARLGTVLELERVSGKVGDKLELEVMFSGGSNKGKVIGEILDQGRGDKILVFKKRRRHMYRRRQGHRQHLTTVQIVEIGGKQIEEKNRRKIVKRTAPVKLTSEQKKERDKRAAQKTSESQLKTAVAEEKSAKSVKKSAGKPGKTKSGKKPSVSTSAKPEARHSIKPQNMGTAKSAVPRNTAPSSGNKG